MIPRPRRSAALAVFVLGELFNSLLERELRSVRLRPNEFAFVSVVGVQGPLTPSELAEFLGMAPTTVSAWIRRTTARGWVRRRPNPDDGRSYLVELTAAGRRVAEAGIAPLQRALREVAEHLERPMSDVLEALGDLEHAARAALNAGATDDTAKAH